MKKIAKPLLILGFFLLGALLTLRVTGLDPEYMDYTTQEYNERGRMTRPGLWLSGEVVKEPIDNWDWVLDVDAWRPVVEHTENGREEFKIAAECLGGDNLFAGFL